MFACVYIPDFPVEAIVRSEPLLRERAIAVLEGKPPQTRVVALNEPARLLGMEIGMTKLQAAVFVNDEDRSDKQVPQRNTPSSIHKAASSFQLAVLRQRSPEQEAAAHAALLDVAHAFSPQVEDSAPDTLLLDLGGMERLYGEAGEMGSALKARVSKIGMAANIAVAANPDAAMHAARGFLGITLIPEGSEAQRLSVLPVQVLLEGLEISSRNLTDKKTLEREREQLREQILDTLERWGVRDFRTLGLLPEHALASRLGQIGTHLRRLACGTVQRTLLLCEPSAQFEEGMELDSPVETIESVAFILNRLLEQLCCRLETRALAAQALQLRLQLEYRVADEQTTTVGELTRTAATMSDIVGGAAVCDRRLQLPVPMRDSKVFLKLLHLDLTAHPPGAPVTRVWIKAEPAPPRSVQRGLFLPVTPEPEKLEITLSRLTGVVGERRAGIARLLDSHRPECFVMKRFRAADETRQQASTTTSEDDRVALLAMRVFRPALPVRVHVSKGRPAMLSNGAAKPHLLQGKILWSAGPWRSSGDWWAANERDQQSGAWDREEWDIALAATGNNTTRSDQTHVALYRIYRDISTGQWFADASYD